MTRANDNIKAGVQTATFWIDESGSKTAVSKCFVVGGIKTRHADDLKRRIFAIREQLGYFEEFKFGRISARNYKPMIELVDLLEDSDVHLIASVIDGTCNPFKGKPQWEAQAAIISRLIQGNLNKNEIGVALLDEFSSPPGTSIGEAVKRSVNGRLRGRSLVEVLSLNSKASDMLQAADLIAGAIRYQRLVSTRGPGGSTEKARVAARLAAAFDVPDLGDRRAKRVNIATLRDAEPSKSPARSRPKKPLRLVNERRRAS